MKTLKMYVWEDVFDIRFGTSAIIVLAYDARQARKLAMERAELSVSQSGHSVLRAAALRHAKKQLLARPVVYRTPDAFVLCWEE